MCTNVLNAIFVQFNLILSHFANFVILILHTPFIPTNTKIEKFEKFALLTYIIFVYLDATKLH